MDFRALGLLGVHHGERPIELRAAKVRSLLAVLLLHHNQVVSADRLADALWSDDRPESAANTLQGYVSQLRKALGSEVIQTRSPGYVLVAKPEQIDFMRFERLLNQGREALATSDPEAAAELLSAALSCWRGEPLADFTFEPFAQASIVRLNELRLAALEAQIEAALAMGRHAELVGRLRSLVDAHPLRERFWEQLITALYRCGRQAEALRACTEVRKRLADELKIEPSAALKSVEDAVILQRPELEWQPVRAAPATSSHVPHNLPPSRSSFVGRHDEMAELEKLLAHGGLVTVVGPGGAGKTRLAREVAYEVRDKFPAGVWFVDLATVEQPSLVPEASAAVLGVAHRPPRSLVDSLLDELAAGRRLLLLDNCEHVISGAADLTARLLSRATGLTVLATSRQPLRIEGEGVWRIPPLAVPPKDDAAPDEIMQSDAVRLFMERAEAIGAFALTAENAAAVAELCRRLDGIPLAIEMAAARSRALTPQQLIARLDDRFGLLTCGARAVARHHTLRASIDWSYNLLTESEKVLFRRLGGFDGSFTLETAEEMCSDDSLPADTVMELLADLVECSLVVADISDGDVRYALTESHRAYARERLADAGEVEVVGLLSR